MKTEKFEIKQNSKKKKAIKIVKKRVYIKPKVELVTHLEFAF